MAKAYLGDGVYVNNDGYHIILTTENGVSITNTIFLEPNVLSALNEYVDALRESARNLTER